MVPKVAGSSPVFAVMQKKFLFANNKSKYILDGFSFAFREVSSEVEHLAEDQSVGGSIPSLLTELR